MSLLAKVLRVLQNRAGTANVAVSYLEVNLMAASGASGNLQQQLL